MMLVDHEIEFRLGSAPLARAQKGRASAPAADDLNAVDDFLAFCARIVEGEPRRLVPTRHERGEVGLGDAFSAAGLGIRRTTPVEHQKAHENGAIWGVSAAGDNWKLSGFQPRASLNPGKNSDSVRQYFKSMRLSLQPSLALRLLAAVAVFAGCSTRSPVTTGRLHPLDEAGPRFGRNQYVEYIPGDLPVIISAPHGGREKPEDIPDRADGTFAFDTNTQELARAIADEFQRRMGHRPHVVICRLHRRKVDCNREVNEAAAGNPKAMAAWEDFQAFLDQAHASVVKHFGKGLFVDLHGHGHADQQLELGYLHTREALAKDDSALANKSSVTNSSLCALAVSNTTTYPKLLRGDRSLGALFEAEGFRATPSPRNPSPSAPYFNGGYNTRRHARDAAPMFGLQIETNSRGVRDKPESREKFAKAFVTVAATFLKEQAGVELPAR